MSTGPVQQEQKIIDVADIPLGFGWGKFFGYIFCVLVPAGIVAVANHNVFPDSSWIALGMIVVTCGVAAIFSIASSFATRKVRRYVLIALLCLGIVLSANVAVHWLLSREVSGAKQAVEARHIEEDRDNTRRKEESERQKGLLEAQRDFLKAQGDLAKSEAQRLRMEAVRNDSARRLGVLPRSAGSVPASPASALVPGPIVAAHDNPPPTPAAIATAQAVLTVAQVMAKWNTILLWMAIADLFSSVVAFGILALVWEWDLNRNGIPDHLERLFNRRNRMPNP
jgi:hypothetical protein